MLVLLVLVPVIAEYGTGKVAMLSVNVVMVGVRMVVAVMAACANAFGDGGGLCTQERY